MSIGTERHGKGIVIYLNKKVRLIIEDGEKTFPRDGILRDFDDYNYYLEMIFGAKKGMTLAFLRSTVRRIEPIEDGGEIKWYS